MTVIRGRTRGPGEPPEFAALRRAYWKRRAWIEALESRICRTDSGVAWLVRVKRIGR